jgi:hypothetical protein
MTFFVERECTIGGCLCPAWQEWFMASEETDPQAVSEERDPVPLEEWPFDPAACERPDICPLYRKHKSARSKHMGSCRNE